MINSVKGSREVKENESRHFLLVDGKKKIIADVKQSSFSRMKYPEER